MTADLVSQLRAEVVVPYKDGYERLRADAARYQWLRERIAPSIIKRISPEQIDQRPEALDALIDCRLERSPTS
jgi:hypothetical protein